MTAAVACATAAVVSSCTADQPAASVDNSSPLGQYYSAALDHRQSNIDQTSTRTGPSTLTYSEVIAQCMAREGFEYWPDDTRIDASPTDPGDALSLAAEVGYGIVVDYAELDPFGGGANTTSPNPNDLYISMMSPAQHEAYDLALYGPIWSEISVAAARGEDVPFDWRRAGCEGAATHALEVARGDQPAASAAATPYDDLLAAMESIPAQIEQEPAWSHVLDRWSACMSRAGIVVTSWDEAVTQIMSEYDAMIAAAQPEVVSTDETVWVDADRSGLPDRIEYEGLREKERRTASADLECRAEVDVEQSRADIQLALERQFLDEHRDELDAMVNWITVHG